MVFISAIRRLNILFRDDNKNSEVIQKVINGREVNSDPFQKPSRSIINFYDFSLTKAEKYATPFNIVKDKVKPIRDKVNRKSDRERWWLYGENRPGLLRKLSKLQHCFVTARTT